MLLFIFLVIALVVLIIFFAILTVKKKNPEFTPPQVNTEPDLNKLDHLVGSVKKKAEQEQIHQQSDQEQDASQQQEEESMQEQEEQEKETGEQTQEKKGPGSRGKPPRKPPTLNLRQAMKSKQFLDRKG